MASISVPFLSYTVSNFNPNHKYRIVLMPWLYWVADVVFAVHDDSIYIAPRLQHAYTLAGRDSSGTSFEVFVQPPRNPHLSLHHLGTVNLRAGGRRIEIRRHLSQAFYGQLVTLGIKNQAGLQQTTLQEVNNLPKKRSRILPITGFLQVGPVYLSIYRAPAGAAWEMPVLSDTLQLHSECLLPRKDVKYEFVVWQNSTIPPWPGDLGVAIEGAT